MWRIVAARDPKAKWHAVSSSRGEASSLTGAALCLLWKTEAMRRTHEAESRVGSVIADHAGRIHGAVSWS
jgi:hypothetical protein